MKQIISDSERKVMEKVWGFGKMITVTDLVVLLNEDGESWTHQTVGTFLKRLEAKGMVSSLKKREEIVLFSNIGQRTILCKRSRSIFTIKISGFFKEFFSSFFKRERIK